MFLHSAAVVDANEQCRISISIFYQEDNYFSFIYTSLFSPVFRSCDLLKCLAVFTNTYKVLSSWCSHHCSSYPCTLHSADRLTLSLSVDSDITKGHFSILRFRNKKLFPFSLSSLTGCRQPLLLECIKQVHFA